MTFTHAVATDNYGPAKFIVDASAANGTHTSIAAALTSASSGDTIFIRPGTYTEDLTLKAGVNLTSFGSDSSLNNTGNVKIIGKATFTGTGSVSIYGVELQTNSDFFLAVTGSNASIVNLNDCFLNASNNAGISFTSSNASSNIKITYCEGTIGTTGIAFFTHSGAGALQIFHSDISNGGSSLTAATISGSGSGTFNFSTFAFCITTSSTSIFGATCSVFDTTAINTTALTIGGSGTNNAYSCQVNSGTASAISVGGTLTASRLTISSTNTNAITGGGTLVASGIFFTPGQTYTVNTTTQNNCGTIQGIRAGNAPAAGYLGEAFNATGASTSITNNTITNLTNGSFTLTPGIWDISAVLNYVAGASYVGTSITGGISTANNTFLTTGDSNIQSSSVPVNNVSNAGLSVPAWRVTISANTTYYLNVKMNFSAGSATASGRMSAVRVG